MDSSEPELLSDLSDTEKTSIDEKNKDRIHLGSPSTSDLFKQSSNNDEVSPWLNTSDIFELQNASTSASEKDYQTKCESIGEETNQNESDDFGCVSLDHSDNEDGTTGKQTTSCNH